MSIVVINNEIVIERMEIGSVVPSSLVQPAERRRPNTVFQGSVLTVKSVLVEGSYDLNLIWKKTSK